MEARVEPTRGAQDHNDRTWPSKTRRRSRLIYVALACLAALAVAGGVLIWGRGKTKQVSGPPPVPVIVAAAAQQDVPIYYEALGTVSAFNTVALRAQVNGQILSVDFRQGQEVKQGDVLAKIDPAPYKAALDQAVAKKADDQAQLVDANK